MGEEEKCASLGLLWEVTRFPRLLERIQGNAIETTNRLLSSPSLVTITAENTASAISISDLQEHLPYSDYPYHPT